MNHQTATAFSLSTFALSDFADILPQAPHGLLVEELAVDRIDWISTGFFTADLA
jgi:hypothetical protein